MFSCGPPFFCSWVGEIVGYGSFDSVPKRFLERTVTIVNEHALAISGKSGEECAEPELLWRVKIVKGVHTLQKKQGKLAAFLRGFDQLAPLRGQNIDSGAPAPLVLLSNLNGEVNQRRNDADGSDHLPNRGKHFPVHEDGVGLTTQAQRPGPREAWIATRARWPGSLQRAWLGRVRNLIHTPQKHIRVTEIREDTNSTLRGQLCRSTPRANANERNANAARYTSIPNSVTNIHGAGK